MKQVVRSIPQQDITETVCDNCGAKAIHSKNGKDYCHLCYEKVKKLEMEANSDILEIEVKAIIRVRVAKDASKCFQTPCFYCGLYKSGDWGYNNARCGLITKDWKDDNAWDRHPECVELFEHPEKFIFLFDEEQQKWHTKKQLIYKGKE